MTTIRPAPHAADSGARFTPRFWRRLNHTLLIGASLLLASGLLSPRARGITIDVVYNNFQSFEPATDPTGSRLTSIVAAAAAHWEDVIEDDYTITLDVWYDTPANVADGALAIAPLTSANPLQNRTVSGDIVFNRESNWFLDATPYADEEYAMTQTLFGDLSADRQAIMYDVTAGTPLLEAGFQGNARATAPAQAQTGVDMLSTALHEIGHHLGVTNQLTGATNEWGDGDYDLPPSLISERVMAARTGDEFGHLTADGASRTLMRPTIASGIRRHPSATDVFAAAAVGDWTQIDLRRKDLLEGSTWNAAAHWEGGQAPDFTDSAFLRVGGDVNLDVNDAVGSLQVSDSTNFHTGSFHLDVTRDTTISSDGAFPFPQIFVDAGGGLQTNDLFIYGGELDVSGGLADVQDTVTILHQITNGAITGFGVVDVQNRLLNDGLLVATDDGTLSFASSSAADVFDLDGTTGNGEVRATSGNIVFTGNTDPAFAGEMTIGAGRFIQIDDAWELADGGELNLNGGTTRTTEADLRGAGVQISGAVNVDKRAELDLPVTFHSTATVALPDADDRLELGASTGQAITYNGGSFTGAGRLVQNGDATVTSAGGASINVGSFDWDGAANSSTTLLPGSGMEINVDALADAHDGDVSMTDAAIAVTTNSGSWDYNGTMTFNSEGSGSSGVVGSQMNVNAGALLHFAGGVGEFYAPVGMLGDMIVEGVAEFNEPISFGSGSTTTLAGGTVRFDDFTNYNGGTITGNGTIQQNGTGFIVDDQAINITGAFDWDGAANNSEFFVNPQKTFNVSATNINAGDNIYGGRLTLIAGAASVNVAADSWTMAGTLVMNGALGQGGLILGDAVDISGDVQTGVSGVHVFAAASRFLSGSTTGVAAGTELRFNAPVAWNGGVHGGAGAIRVNDIGVVGDRASIGVETLIVSGSSSFTMEGGVLTATNVDKLAGSAFDFLGGVLHVGQFNGDLVNLGGTLAPGQSAGITRIDGDYAQQAGATLQIEIGGLDAGRHYDRLTVGSTLTAGGTLQILLMDDFSPRAGDVFDVLDWGAMVSTFDLLRLPLLADRAWDVSALYKTGVLAVVEAPGFSADFDDDGDVDGDDLNEWQGDFGANALSDADGDSDSDGADFLQWQRQLISPAPIAASAHPVPEPGTAVLLLAAALSLPSLTANKVTGLNPRAALQTTL